MSIYKSETTLQLVDTTYPTTPQVNLSFPGVVDIVQMTHTNNAAVIASFDGVNDHLRLFHGGGSDEFIKWRSTGRYSKVWLRGAGSVVTVAQVIVDGGS